MPSPVGLVVKNGWNSLSRISGGMPMPLSRTRISTASPRSRVVTFRVGRKSGLGAVALALGGGVEAVAEQVQEDARDVLRDQLDRRDGGGEIALQGDVEALVLGAGAVIGEVQRLLDQRVEIDLAALAAARRANARACS